MTKRNVKWCKWEDVGWSKPFMNSRKKVGDRTEPCGTPEVIVMGEEQ